MKKIRPGKIFFVTVWIFYDSQQEGEKSKDQQSTFLIPHPKETTQPSASSSVRTRAFPPLRTRHHRLHFSSDKLRPVDPSTDTSRRTKEAGDDHRGGIGDQLAALLLRPPPGQRAVDNEGRAIGRWLRYQGKRPAVKRVLMS